MGGIADKVCNDDASVVSELSRSFFCTRSHAALISCTITDLYSSSSIRFRSSEAVKVSSVGSWESLPYRREKSYYL